MTSRARATFETPKTQLNHQQPADKFIYCMGLRLAKPYIKIGYSRHPGQRLFDVNHNGAHKPNGWDGEPVELLAVRFGDYQDETLRHRELREYRVAKTEWFLGHEAVVGYLKADEGWTMQQGLSFEDYKTEWTDNERKFARNGYDPQGPALDYADFERAEKERFEEWCIHNGMEAPRR